jgi:hypothetical protein
MSTKMLMAMALACACALPVFAASGVVDLSGHVDESTIPDGAGATQTADGFFSTSFTNSASGEDVRVWNHDGTGYGSAGLPTVYGLGGTAGSPAAIRMSLHAGKHSKITVTGFDVVGYSPATVSGVSWSVNGAAGATSGTTSGGGDSESVSVNVSSKVTDHGNGVSTGSGFVNIVIQDESGGNIGIQNVAYTTEVIPEPSSLLLALAGLLGMTLFRGRRQR